MEEAKATDSVAPPDAIEAGIDVPETRDSPEEKAPRLDEESAANPDLSKPTDDDVVVDGASGGGGPATTSLPTAAATATAAAEEEDCDVYQVKWVGWQSSKTPIVTQNENGPCPLISIVNILLLRGKLRLPDGCDVVSADQLLEYLGDVIIESVPSEMSTESRLDYEQNVHDAIAIMPKLQTGLDVNVRFTGVCDFEYTPECIIFDLLNISLYHGWLLDPQQIDVVSAIQNLTYNQLVEKIISQKHSEDSHQVSQSLIAQQFLEESASQLTFHGLCELMSAIKDGELAVFFRNNHFSAIYKEKKELFLLVTDQGFLKESKVVWETLSSIDGDGHFVDDKFATVPPSDEQPTASSLVCDSPSKLISSDSQIDRDHQLAMVLAEEDSKRVEREVAWEEFKVKTAQQGVPLSDEELAKKLQAEEDDLAARQENQQQQQQQPASASSPTSSGGPAVASRAVAVRPQSNQQPNQRAKNCVIL